jgi:hypothetical protein
VKRRHTRTTTANQTTALNDLQRAAPVSRFEHASGGRGLHLHVNGSCGLGGCEMVYVLPHSGESPGASRGQKAATKCVAAAQGKTAQSIPETPSPARKSTSTSCQIQSCRTEDDSCDSCSTATEPGTATSGVASTGKTCAWVPRVPAKGSSGVRWRGSARSWKTTNDPYNVQEFVQALKR